MNNKIESSRGENAKAGKDLETTTKPYFYKEIMEEPLPRRLIMSLFEIYDGTLDPMDLLKSFKALMMLQWVIDTIMCLAFLATLMKTTWF